jgi:hypothetical protein
VLAPRVATLRAVRPPGPGSGTQRIGSAAARSLACDDAPSKRGPAVTARRLSCSAAAAKALLLADGWSDGCVWLSQLPAAEAVVLRMLGGAALQLTRLMAVWERAAENGEPAIALLAAAAVVEYPTSSWLPGKAPVPFSAPGDAAPPPLRVPPPVVPADAASARRVAAAAPARAVA